MEQEEEQEQEQEVEQEQEQEQDEGNQYRVGEVVEWRDAGEDWALGDVSLHAL